jgi:hypothetical protein
MSYGKSATLLAAALILAVNLVAAGLAQEPRTERVEWRYAMLVYDGSAVTFLSPDGDVGPTQETAMFGRLADLYGGPSPATRGIYAGLLNAIGRGGWELVSVDNATLTFVFKRPN